MARICNSMYSFHRLFYAGKMTATEFPGICASLGIREIEPLDRWIPSDDAGLSRFEAAIKEANCAVAQLTCGIGLFAADEAKRREKVEEAKKWARIAHRLGAPAMRIDTGWEVEDMALGMKQVIKSFQEIAPLCEELGVVATIENHGGVSKSADDIVKIIEAVGSKHLGTCPDFGNFAEEVRYDSLAKVAPHAAHIHAKTLKFDARGNETAFDYPRCVRIFRDAGYRGAWGIEFEGELEGATPDELTGVKLTKALLDRLL